MEDILVVDDNRIMLGLFKRILSREGLRVHYALSGEDALEQIKERTFSLMITDFNMPGLNGLDLARKGMEMAPQMPIIMDTGGISPKITRLAKEIGIAKILIKPFHPTELMNTVKDVMGTSREWASSTA